MERRSYDDGCGIAHALDLVGERWALLVVRELLLGPKRFTDLRAGLPGVSANVLTQRLRELDDAEVVRRRKLAPPAGSWVYELTDRGQELEPIVLQLGSWGARSTSLPRDATLGVDSAVLYLRTQFDPVSAAGVHAEYELHLGEHRFRVLVDDGRLDVDRGVAAHPDVVFDVTPRELEEIVSGERTAPELARSADGTAPGDRAAAERFATLFVEAA